MIGGERVEVTVTSSDAVSRASEILAKFSGGDVQVNERARKLIAPMSGGSVEFRHVLRDLEDAGISVYDVGMRRPTLDDVFLNLTGHAAEVEAELEKVEG